MGKTERIEIEIVLDDGSIKKGFATIEKQGGKAADGIGSKFKSAFSNLKNILGPIALAFAAFRAVKGIATDFLKFEKSLAEIRTITQGLNIDNAKLADTLTRVAGQFGTSSQEQARSFYQIISAGVTDAARAQELLIQANKLAIGGLTTAETSIDLLTSTVNAFGQESLSARRAADILFGTVRLGKTRIEELAGSLGMILPTAKAIGVSFEDTAAAVAQLTTKGLTTSIAVTQLNAVFTAVLKKQETAKKLGPEVAKAFSLQALQVKGLTTFLKDLNKSLGGSETKLTKLLGRVEGSKAILSLASDNFVGLKDKVDQLKNSSGAADAAFKQVSNTLGFQLTAAGAKLSAFFTRTLSDSGTFFADLGTLVNKFVETSVAFVESFSSNIDLTINDLKTVFTKITKSATEASIKLREFLDLDTTKQNEQWVRINGQLEKLDVNGKKILETGAALVTAGSLVDGEATALEVQKAIVALSNLRASEEEYATAQAAFKAKVAATSQRIAASISQALASGSNVLQAFIGSIFSDLGDFLIGLGVAAIGIGTLIETIKASLATFLGTFGIAGGIAAIALGAALKSFSGSKPSGANLGGGGGVSTGATDAGVTAGQPVDIAEAQKPTEVNIDITGQVVDPRGTALQIAELLRDIQDSNGAIMVNV